MDMLQAEITHIFHVEITRTIHGNYWANPMLYPRVLFTRIPHDLSRS